MTLFSKSTPRRKAANWGIATLLIISFGSLAVLPSGYVIQRPGQVFNVMGEINGEPVISSTDLESYESESRFDVTTVSLLGNRESNPNWIQVLWAWFDTEQVVLPLDEVYPPTKTTEQVRAESTAQMEISQQDGIAAALSQMGYTVPRKLFISSVIEKTPASGKLVAGDLVIKAGDLTLDTFEQLKEKIQLSQGESLDITVLRDGKELVIPITPAKRDDGYFIGAMVGYTYEFPVEIKLQLGDVGGPSGGLMFTLGILDAFSKGSLAGDKHISGTGTITATGLVGPIGGIKLKMIAAKNSGADLFLIPADNCQEALGGVPSGLNVASVRDLSQALIAVEKIKNNETLPPLECKNN
jgi:Lon-like protease